MNHNHHCDHDLAYCASCDAAYCRKCSQEWGTCRLPHYYSTPWYSIGPNWTVTSGDTSKLPVMEGYNAHVCVGAG